MSGNESRVQAIYQITNREPTAVKKTSRLGKIWADDVFNLAEWNGLYPKQPLNQ